MSTIVIALVVLAGAEDILASMTTWAPGPPGDLDWFSWGHVSQQRCGVFGGAVSAAPKLCQSGRSLLHRRSPGRCVQCLRYPPEITVRTPGEASVRACSSRIKRDR